MAAKLPIILTSLVASVKIKPTNQSQFVTGQAVQSLQARGGTWSLRRVFRKRCFAAAEVLRPLRCVNAFWINN